MIIYLIRHGQQSTRNGRSDGQMVAVGLSHLGRLQARAAANGLAHEGIERIFASPVARAQETAEIIGAKLGLNVKYDERLREFIADAQSADPKHLHQLKLECYAQPTKVPPSGESYAMAVERYVGALEEIAQLPHTRIAVVAHRMVMEGALAKLFNYREGAHDWMHPAGVTAVEFREGKGWRLVYADKQFRNFAMRAYRLLRRAGFVS